MAYVCLNRLSHNIIPSYNNIVVLCNFAKEQQVLRVPANIIP